MARSLRGVRTPWRIFPGFCRICLTDLGPFQMVLSHREAMAETDFGRRLLAVLRDAVAENPYLELEEQ